MQENFSVSAEAKMSCQVEAKVVEEGMCVYRLTRKSVVGEDFPTQLSSFRTSSISEGFASVKSIRDFQAGKTAGITPYRKEYVLANPLFLEEIQKLSYYDVGTSLNERGEVDIFPDPFSKFLEGKLKVDNIVTVDYGSNMVFDRKDRPLPMLHHFDYINARMSEGQYDLKKALDILRQTPGVTFPARVDSRSRGQSASGEILNVPGYNVSKGCSKYLSFSYVPDFEMTQELWALQKRINSKYPSTAFYQAVFELDALGLRKAGAALHEKFYDSTSDKEDDD